MRGKGQAVELGRPHPPPGRASCNTTSAQKLCQANTGLALRRCPRTRYQKCSRISSGQRKVEKPPAFKAFTAFPHVEARVRLLGCESWKITAHVHRRLTAQYQRCFQKSRVAVLPKRPVHRRKIILMKHERPPVELGSGMYCAWKRKG